MSHSVTDETATSVKACRRHFATAAAFSFALNVLHLAAPLYMMQVYDRVISSGSETTLAMLTIVTLGAFAALAGIDRARTSVLAAASLRLDRLLAGRVFSAMMSNAVKTGDKHNQALRDLDTCRSFVCGHGMTAMFDLPWLPLYILVIGFGLHPALGLFAFLCAAVLVAMAVLSEVRVRALSSQSHARNQAAYTWAEASLRNAHAVQAMAMMPGLLRRWSRERSGAVVTQQQLSERTSAMTALVRFLRMSMQSLVLGLGAWLVIERAATPGSIFAASLLLGRALQPIEQIIGQWQTLLSARTAFSRVRALLISQPAPDVLLATSERQVEGRLIAENVGYSVGNRPEPILEGINFTIEPGESIGLIGPSGAGKSTLVRMLVGAIAPTQGAIRLGEREISSTLSPARGSAIGYLPQDIELFADTIAANISRFENCSERDISYAAQIAGAHDMIMRLPQGYATTISEGGASLSGGMRQRIALARAVFGQPSLVILDEPNSNLDSAGDDALTACIDHLQRQGTTVVMVSHRQASTHKMHKFIVLIDGRLEAFGSREEISRQFSNTGNVARPRAEAVARPAATVRPFDVGVARDNAPFAEAP